MSRAPAGVTDPPVHERHACALEALARSEHVLAALGLDDGAWRRTFGRFLPDAAAFATLVFERDGDGQEIVVVEAHARRPDADAAPLRGTDGAAWLVARDFRADPRLRH